MSLVNQAETFWLDQFIRNAGGTAYTYPLELALFATTSAAGVSPGDVVNDGAATVTGEVRGNDTTTAGAPVNGYARAVITTWNAAISGNPTSITNNTTITFPQDVTADWANPTLFVNGWVIFEGNAAAGDRAIWSGQFDTGKHVQANDTVSIAGGTPGNLALRLD